MEQDLYNTLGVTKDATEKQIRKAYKRLSKLYHPDKQIGKSQVEQDEAKDRFLKIKYAYEVLTNQERRDKYNETGQSELPNQQNAITSIIGHFNAIVAATPIIEMSSKDIITGIEKNLNDSIDKYRAFISDTEEYILRNKASVIRIKKRNDDQPSMLYDILMQSMHVMQHNSKQSISDMETEIETLELALKILPEIMYDFHQMGGLNGLLRPGSWD